MTYEEKGKWIYFMTSVLGFLAYAGIILVEAQDKVITEIVYVPVLLWVIGATVAATIVGQIAIAIAKPQDADKKRSARQGH